MSIREAVARAICCACEDNPDHLGDARGNDYRWQDYLETADAAIVAERNRCIKIIETFEIPMGMGKDHAAHLACEWTLTALKKILKDIRSGV